MSRTPTRPRSEAVSEPRRLVPNARNGVIYFDTNDHKLDAWDKIVLDNFCDAVKAYHKKHRGTPRISALGQTDHRASPGYNQTLSEQRAQNVIRFLHKRLPDAVYVLNPKKTLGRLGVGELWAKQPRAGVRVSEADMAKDRCVEIYYDRIDPLHIRIFKEGIRPDDVEKLKEYLDQGIRLAIKKKGAFPNQCQRIICYLKKLRQHPTGMNDNYWTYENFIECEQIAMKGGYSKKKMNKAREKLYGMATSMRMRILADFSIANDEEEKFKKLLAIDREIFRSYAMVSKRIRWVAGIVSMRQDAHWWVPVGRALHEYQQNRETLYSCIVGEPEVFGL